MFHMMDVDFTFYSKKAPLASTTSFNREKHLLQKPLAQDRLQMLLQLVPVPLQDAADHQGTAGV